MKAEKTVIGRWEYMDFLDFKIKDIPVKIDTGAYTSSLRCSKIEEITQEDNTILRYTILRPDHPIPLEKRTFETAQYTTRKVKNSSGKLKTRYSITTTVRIFDEDQLVEFTLAKRQGLKFPVLLGRKFLGKQYLVDPSKTSLSKKNHQN